MPFLFTNALLLGALAALGIPVLLHLLLKRRNQRIKFSTLRFIETQETRSTSRRKLRNLFLLLLRLLIFALIILAFARPFWPKNQGNLGIRPRRQVVIVLDHSLSLSAQEGGIVRWTKAMEAARKTLNELGSEDRAALVGCGSRAVVLAGFASASVTLRKLEILKVEASTSELGEGLAEATRLIAASDAGFDSSIVVISDLQRSAAETLGAVAMPREVPVNFLSVGGIGAPNFAVTGLDLALSETNKPSATVSNFGEATGSVTVEFRLDRKTVWSQQISLEAGSVTNLTLSLLGLAPGWHDVVIQLSGKDALTADDARQATFLVPAPIRVLLVENRVGVRSFEEQTFFILAALDPFFGMTNARAGRFHIEQVYPEGLVGKLREQRPVIGLGTNTAAFDVVILPALQTLPGEAASGLGRFVRSGGGLLLLGGDGVSPTRFNAEFAGILPIQLGEAVAADEEVPWRIGMFDRRSPVFSVFAQDGGGTPTLAEFTRRQTIQAGPGLVVLARFDDGIPFLLEATVGQGRFLFANMSADTAWTDWPKHKSYVPWLWAATSFLAGRSGDRVWETGLDFVTAREAVLEVGIAAAKTAFTLTPVGGSALSQKADSQGKIAFEMSEPGVHSLRDGVGREWLRLAANVPSQESDLTAMPVLEAERRIVWRTEESQRPLRLFGNDRQREEFWRLLMLAALVLVFTETLVSNRTTA